MKKILYLVVSLIGFDLVSAELKIQHEIELRNGSGKMLNQVSGLAKFDKWLVVLSQDQDKLFYIEQNRIKQAISNKRKSIQLKHVALIGSNVPASWEAIDFAKLGSGFQMFLSHEHDEKNDAHQIFTAKVHSYASYIEIEHLSKLGPQLPLLSHEDVPEPRRYNYGYEAILYEPSSKLLWLLPELKHQHLMSMSLAGELTSSGLTKHNLRASDMVKVGKQCALVSSNCFASNKFTDVLCQAGENKPRLSLSLFKIENDNIKQTDELDVSDVLSKVAYQDRFNNQKEFDYYNFEGLVNFENGFLTVNDNIPVNKAKTALRFVTLDGLDSQQCQFY